MTEADMLSPDDFILSNILKKGGELDLTTHNLDEIEKVIIQKVLKQYQGNITQAAQDLGLTRASLYTRMEKHGL